MSSTSSSLVIQSPAMAPGLYDFILPIGDLGIALLDLFVFLILFYNELFKIFILLI